MPLIQMPRPVPPLQADGILLRPPEPGPDSEAYLRLYSDPAIYTYVGDTRLNTVQDAELELTRLIGIPTISLWVIADPANEILGRYFLNLDQRLNERVVGEGNRIRPDCWRSGVNRSARRLMFGYAFGELHADAYETECHNLNTNSVRSILSYGFHQVSRDQDVNRFRLTRSQYQSRAD